MIRLVKEIFQHLNDKNNAVLKILHSKTIPIYEWSLFNDANNTCKVGIISKRLRTQVMEC
jgi:hypothetical protein